jgi:hypothetical protein
MKTSLLVVGVASTGTLACATFVGLLSAMGACGGSPTSGGFVIGDEDTPGTPVSGENGDGGAPTFARGDGGTFQSDGDVVESDGAVCELGSASSFATMSDLNLFGQIVYYEDGGSLPPGRYRAKYVSGCMKYDYVFSWQVQAQAPGPGAAGFWFVGDTSDDRIVMPPGSTSSYPVFDDCVRANQAVPPEEFQFDGGKIGVWLNDTPYSDNIPGGDGGNPNWQLTLLGVCPPNLAPK